MMRLFKRVGGTIIVLLVIVSLVASCFAAGAESILPAEIFGTLYSSYLAARGIGVVLSENNVASSSSNAIPADPAASMWLDLYTRSNARLPSNDQMSIDDWVDFAESHVSTNIGPAGNVAPTSTTFQLGSQLVEWFDKVTTDLLSVDLGVPSDSGVYHTGGNFFDSTIAYQGTSPWAVIPVVSEGKYWPILNQGLPVSYNNGSVAFALGITSPGNLSVAVYRDSDSYHYLVVSPVASGFYEAGFTPGYTWNIAVDTPISDSGYYYSSRVFQSSSLNPSIPVYDSLNSALSGFTSAVSDTRIQLRPEDKYNEGLRDKDGNVLPKGDVYVPDATAEGYIPDTLTGTWNLPWSDSYADSGSLPSILDAVKELVNANEPVLELDDVAPDPVEIPFLPPGAITDLPSFEFSLSGIWHYVVDWVSSLSFGFTLISSAWSALPFAMVIPIYASAVVVIVLGMWKRFFS